ncbi:MAG: hypothetical protein MJ141_07405, partial [Clostridia bacterium]|nr:hypothetical protein [Clostridia bacterium]
IRVNADEPVGRDAHIAPSFSAYIPASRNAGDGVPYSMKSVSRMKSLHDEIHLWWMKSVFDGLWSPHIHFHSGSRKKEKSS